MNLFLLVDNCGALALVIGAYDPHGCALARHLAAGGAPEHPRALFALVLVILGSSLFWLWRLAAQAREMTIQVAPDGLHITAPLYGKHIPRSILKPTEATIVNFGERPELLPRWKTNGIGMPNISIGWFRLRNKHKALVYLAHSTTALLLPTTQDYLLLLGSPKSRPADLLTSLKNLA